MNECDPVSLPEVDSLNTFIDETEDISTFELQNAPVITHFPTNVCEQSVGPPRCRICYEEGSASCELISPCRCKGTVGLLHKACLEHWLQVSQTIACEICGYFYNLRLKTPSTAGGDSAKTSISVIIERAGFLREWLNSLVVRRSLATDCAFLAILAPITCFGVYFCIRASLIYAKSKVIYFWKNVLFTLIAASLTFILLLAFILVLKHHLLAYWAYRRQRVDGIRAAFYQQLIERHWRFSVHQRASISTQPYSGQRGSINLNADGIESSIITPPANYQAILPERASDVCVV